MKKYILVLISFALAFGCGISYHLQGGATIAPDGTLVEPFYLIPLTWLFIFIGIILAIVFGIGVLVNKMKKAD